MNQNPKTTLGLAEISMTRSRQELSLWFQRFASQTVGSPMYQYLSARVSGDAELLSLAEDCDRRQPVPNLFFAAVHFLLIQNPAEELAKHYPSLGGVFVESPNMFECFKTFCIKFESEIKEILRSRLVQTNEVQRCAILSPALDFVSKKAGQNKIALVDVGVSGGLNFLLDHSFIQYSDGRTLGPERSALKLFCKSDGSPIPEAGNTRVVDRIGVDLNPVNLLDKAERQWNFALIWPDQLERTIRFESAIELLKRIPIRFEKGGGIEVLPQIAPKVSSDHLLCVMHSFTLNQFSTEDRERFESVLSNISIYRDVWRISLEWIGTPQPEVVISQYVSGQMAFRQKVAECGGHGEWIRWIAQGICK